MNTRDFDRWARLVASSCSRRRTIQVVGAGAMAWGLGHRARFDALAAELGCCKCSGTLRCEIDVATYGECKTLCGPRKQAIFAPNYTCTRGNSLSKVCKPKRKATGATLLAGAPGVYDLAFVDTVAAATIPGLSPVTTEAIFTAEAAIAAGFVQGNAAAVLFEEGVQVYHSLWRDASETLGVFSHLSQHLSAEAAARWYDYAASQLGPANAEAFDFELSGTDAGTLIRFAFPSQTEPGATVTRLMAMTLTGEFVNWFGIDGRDTVPDPELARTFAQAVVDTLIDRPEQTASLAPYVALMPGAAACLPAFPVAAAKRAALGPAGFQDPDAECEAATGSIRYTIWDGAYVPRDGAPAESIELNQTFFAGADRVLDQTYAVGDQIRTVTIANWWHADVTANDGQIFFANRAQVDAARGAVRQDLDMPHAGASGPWFCSAVAFPAGDQWLYGVDAVAFAGPYSLTHGVLRPGPPLEDPATWAADETPVIVEELWPIIANAEAAMGLDTWHAALTGLDQQPLPTFGSALVSPSQGEEVVLVPGRRDLGAAIASLVRSPHMAGFGEDPENGITYSAAENPYGGYYDAFDPNVIGPLFNDHGLIQVRVNEYFTGSATESLRVDQQQFPDRASAEAGFDLQAGVLAQRGQADLTVEIPGQTQSLTVRSNVVDDRGREVVRHETVVQVGEIVVAATYDVVNPQADPTARLTALLGDLLAAYDDDAWAGDVGIAVQPVTPWIPWMNGVGAFQDGLPIVDGVSYGSDPDATAAANPGVLTARVGHFRFPIPGEIEVQWGARSFVDPTALADYLARLPDLRPEFTWFAQQPLEELAEFPHVVYCVTTRDAASIPMVGAYVAVQAEETIAFDFAALVPFPGDAAMLAEHDPTTDANFVPLSSGIASIYLALDDYVKNFRLPPGFLGDPQIEPPPIWFELTPGGPIVQGNGEADVDPALLRDLGATAATFGLSSALRGYQVTNEESHLTKEAIKAAFEAWAERARPEAEIEDIVKRYFENQESIQLRVDKFATDDESKSVEFMQWQYPVPPTPEAWDKAQTELGGKASAGAFQILEDPDSDVSGLTWQDEAEDEEDIIDIRYLLIMAGEVGAIVTHATKREEASDGSTGSQDWAREVFEDLSEWYDEDDWAGEVGEAVQDVAPWLPALDAQTQWYFHHYYGIVDGQPLPRSGDDPDRIAAENPWVRNALFGGYGLNTGLGELNVSFGVRSFAGQDDADDYFAQAPSLLESNRIGVAWRPADEVDPGFDRRYIDRYFVHGGTRNPAEDDYQVGAGITFQVGKTVVDLSAFTHVKYTGDPEAFADHDPLADPVFAPLSDGLTELIRDAYERAISEVPRGYLPSPLALPTAWQLPVAEAGVETNAEAPLQYDPIAWVGNVALALPDFEITPLAFVYDPQHEAAVPGFYGAEPPAGWQGVLRTALFLPNPDAANGQGFDQALYLRGHWFGSNADAREWYGTGKLLLEESGNGNYVEQTGEAEFGIQRTVWGASFPTADNPDVTINRGIGWFRRGNVVVEATLDAHCAGAAGPGTFCAEGVVPYLIEELGNFIDEGLKAAETEGTVTGKLPVLEDTQVVQVDLTQWGDQAITRFGDAPEQRERRDEFGFDANAHVALQYVGSTDAGSGPVAVFTNSWVTDSFIETRQILEEALNRFVEASDAQIGAEREEIPSLTLSGEGWAITANAFVFPQADGSKVGGVEVRAARDTVLSTAAVVTPRPPETTARSLAEEFERHAAEAVCDPSAPPSAGADVNAQIAFLAMFFNLDLDQLVVAIGGGGGGLVDVIADWESLQPALGEEPPPPVGQWIDIVPVTC